jgi:secreted PhoX family phosphatase
MSEERVAKRLYQNTPEGSRNVGRPRLRWMDDVGEDLRTMGVTTWRIRAHRNDWKTVVKEAKLLQGL